MVTKLPKQKFPVLVLKNVLALPRKIIPVKVSRDFTLKAVEKACAGDGSIFVATQIDPEIENPSFEEVYKIGIIAKVVQSTTEKDGSCKILIEGMSAARLLSITPTDGFLLATVEQVPQFEKPEPKQAKALVRQLHATFDKYITTEHSVATDIVNSIKETHDLEVLIELILVHINFPIEQICDVLEQKTLEGRVTKICALMLDEIEILKAEKNIRKRVLKQIEKHQKDYYLNEQMRAIYRELGKEDGLQEIETYRNQAKQAKLPKEVSERVLAECKKLEMMQLSSPEAVVSRNYIEWILSLPWHKKSQDSISMSEAQIILDQSHYGMKKVKERIVEFIAAKKFAGDKLKKCPIICLVGPPGVGKTSLAQTIAKALGRSFVRISLGGLKDEAEIRGHRRTYIGATVGKIIGAMKKAQVINPVILLDEIDKMSMDMRGDPSAALLEALDIEQNEAFTDHFLEIGYNLSKVVFIATANVVDNIPYPLADRMEIVNLSGYTTEEKLHITREFLIPNLIDEHAIEKDQVAISSDTICKVIENYTREAGVRQLTRVLAKLIRQGIVRILETDKTAKFNIDNDFVKLCLGSEKFKPFAKAGNNSIGVATGLAWTEVGGDVLEIETCLFKGKGALTLTGQLGEVMQESAQAALSFIRSQEKELGLKNNFYSTMDIHVHIPEGATPKDGPSAGITIAAALISALTKVPVASSLAMSGEITLRGKILPVGGLKEKILAAIRYGLTKVLVPAENKAEVMEFVNEIINSKVASKFSQKVNSESLPIEIVYVNTMHDALKHCFEKNFKPAIKTASIGSSGTTKRRVPTVNKAVPTSKKKQK